jgi:hypothetical protein
MYGPHIIYHTHQECNGWFYFCEQNDFHGANKKWRRIARKQLQQCPTCRPDLFVNLISPDDVTRCSLTGFWHFCGAPATTTIIICNIQYTIYNIQWNHRIGKYLYRSFFFIIVISQWVVWKNIDSNFWEWYYIEHPRHLSLHQKKLHLQWWWWWWWK